MRRRLKLARSRRNPDLVGHWHQVTAEEVNPYDEVYVMTNRGVVKAYLRPYDGPTDPRYPGIERNYLNVDFDEFPPMADSREHIAEAMTAANIDRAGRQATLRARQSGKVGAIHVPRTNPHASRARKAKRKPGWRQFGGEYRKVYEGKGSARVDAFPGPNGTYGATFAPTRPDGYQGDAERLAPSASPGGAMRRVEEHVARGGYRKNPRHRKNPPVTVEHAEGLPVKPARGTVRVYAVTTDTDDYWNGNSKTFRFASEANAVSWASRHTRDGRPASVWVSDVPAKLAARWGI